MERANNDATLSKLGDIYQYYIALLECFNMGENEKIQIEVSGDVSKISEDTTSFQMEVKHHIGDDTISDRDIDFWKTVKNWVKEFKEVPDNDEDGNLNITKRKDIGAVNNMYKTIFDEVECIGKTTGIMPQVIIADHVDGEELEVKDTFKKCTRRTWRDDEALI